MQMNIALLVNPSKTFFWVYNKKYLIVDFAGVYEVEDLHHDEGIEDEGSMSWINSSILEDIFVVYFASDGEKHATSSHAIFCVFPVSLEAWNWVKSVWVFGDDGWSAEDEDEQDNYLEESLSQDMLEHGGRYNIVISFVGVSLKQGFSWGLSGQGQGSKGIHDQVDP